MRRVPLDQSAVGTALALSHMFLVSIPLGSSSGRTDSRREDRDELDDMAAGSEDVIPLDHLGYITAQRPCPRIQAPVFCKVDYR